MKPVSRARVWLIRVGLVVVLALAWELISNREGGLFIPDLGAIGSAFVEQLSSPKMWDAFVSSNQALFAGFLIALVTGVPLGLALGRSRKLDGFMGFYLDLGLVVPMIAVVPVVIVALGLTLQARIFTVILFVLPVVAIDARAAVRTIDRGRLEMAQSFNASRWQQWRLVILPAALGPIMTGVRLGLSRAVAGMIVIELTLVPAGLGGLLNDYRSRFAAATVYAVTVVIVLEGILLVWAARRAEQRVSRRLLGGVA